MAKSTIKSLPLNIGETVELKINSMAYDNSAVAKYKDFVVFVDRGAPGDEVIAEVTSLRPNYARAKIKEIKKSEQDYRIEADCKLFKVCGGCQWQHLPYEKQLEQKNLLMQNFVSKLSLEKEVLKPIIGASEKWHYRNKVQYPVRTIKATRRLKAGYFEWHSNDLVNIKFCPIQNSFFDAVIDTVRELAEKYNIIAYDSKTKIGWLRHICLRIGENTGEALLTLVAINEKLSRSQDFANELMVKHPELVGVCININTNTTNVIYGPRTLVLKGKGFIFEKIGDLRFKISATSFFQVNTSQAAKLIEIVKNMVCRDVPVGRLYNTIFDAFCGGGLIALSLAKYAKQVVGVEEIKQSIDDAIFSAKENKIKNFEFVVGKVENKVDSVLERYSPDVVILDPPRVGCNKKIIESLCSTKAQSIKKIVYVSCNPTTLVRDLEILCRRDVPMGHLYPFEIKSIQPIDMFPHTYHIENIVLLERKEAD